MITEINPEDVILWPCGTWCYYRDLHRVQNKSSDYKVVPKDSDEWVLIVFVQD